MDWCAHDVGAGRAFDARSDRNGDNDGATTQARNSSRIEQLAHFLSTLLSRVCKREGLNIIPLDDARLVAEPPPPRGRRTLTYSWRYVKPHLPQY